ncbi:MAG TPA: peptidase [Nitrosopumilaceae archaeon]|nr:peptidase [Nitrosopumilaceae archaeon]
MLIRKKIFGFLIIMIIFPFIMADSFGHGVGFEVLPPVKLGDRMVSLEVTSSQYQNPDSPDREIIFSLLDIKTGIILKDVTYNIEAKKKDQILFDETFKTTDGILVMDFLHSDSEKISLKHENKASFFDSLIGSKKNVVEVTGKPFNTGGLYKFKVLITTADSFFKPLEIPIEYNVGLSIPQRNFYNVNDPNFGSQQLSVVTYYDEIEDFQYNPATKSITFSMPFEWTKENVNQTSILHEELTIPKTFGDLMVSEFSIKINDEEVPQRVITIDGFSEVQRIIHIVLNQNDLLELYKKQKEGYNRMNFSLKPQSENLPLSTVTGNGQFRIILDWEPKMVSPGSKIIFYFDIMDVFLKDRPVSVSYDLSVLHEDKIIFTQTGISTSSKNEHNIAEFVIPNDVKGVISVQFNNLDGNSLARVGLPIVVDRIEISEIKIPEWVRNNAGWWSSRLIEDNDFALGIEFMIKEGIITIPSMYDRDYLENSIIPDWVRNNAGWWSEGLISDKEFANGLQYLISNGIISV